MCTMKNSVSMICLQDTWMAHPIHVSPSFSVLQSTKAPRFPSIQAGHTDSAYFLSDRGKFKRCSLIQIWKQARAGRGC